VSDCRKLFGFADAVVVAVPTQSHFEVARSALIAGLDVLVEKPLASTVSEGESLLHLARTGERIMQVGHIEWFNAAMPVIRENVHGPRFVEAHRLGPFTARAAGIDVVKDLMIHDIDIILNLVESPVADINVMGASIFSDKEDLANVQLRFENGCLANIIASRATQEKIRTLSVTQEKEYILLDYAHQDILVHRQAASAHELTRQQLKYKQESFIERIFVHRENPLKLEIRHLIDCATNGAVRRTSVENELKSLKIALTVLEQLNAINKPAVGA